MRLLFLLFWFMLFVPFGFSQPVNSDCTVPQVLIENYELDIKGLALKRMIDTDHPDLGLVQIPQSHQDSIAEAMAAILNAAQLPERDSVFNIYCVHNGSWQLITSSVIVSVDENYNWTSNWQNLITETGDTLMDYITSTYSLEVASYSSFAVLETPKLWNVNALCDSLELVEGVNYAEPNYLIGGAGRIAYDIIDGVKYLDFEVQWNDCFDGCDNRHTWHFKVYDDCSVEFTGVSDFGFFGIEPLPDPVNCNIVSPIVEVIPKQNKYSLSPNPVSTAFVIGNVEDDERLDITLLDVSGRQILKANILGKEPVKVSNLDSGTYFVRITDEHGWVEVLRVVMI